VEGFTYSRVHPSRNRLIDGLRSYNFAHRIKGKGGLQIKRSTIARWLTSELENALRVEATDALLAAERVKSQK
jgi:hypothetical protein